VPQLLPKCMHTFQTKGYLPLQTLPAWSHRCAGSHTYNPIEIWRIYVLKLAGFRLWTLWECRHWSWGLLSTCILSFNSRWNRPAAFGSANNWGFGPSSSIYLMEINKNSL
jgi:hypothetical protein